MIRVLIADDQAMVRGALAALLSLEEDIDVVAEASNGEEALAIARTTDIDVALLDIEMPSLDGIEATAAITREGLDARCLIVTTFGRPGYLRRALDAGASGFVVKETPAEKLAEAVRKVHAGGRVVDPALATESLFEGGKPPHRTRARNPAHRPRRRQNLKHREKGSPERGDGAKLPILGNPQNRRRDEGCRRKTRQRTRMALERRQASSAPLIRANAR